MNESLCLDGGLLRSLQGDDKSGLLRRNSRFGKSGVLRREHPAGHTVIDGALSQQSSGGTHLALGAPARRLWARCSPAST